MLRFFRIERPTTTTLRPHSTATSAACCMRWMFDANDATRIFPRRSGKIERNASPTSRSEPVLPGRSAFVESPRRRSTPRFPISASVPTSVFSPSTGVWSSFQSPVCTTRPAGVSMTSAAESGIECATRTSSTRNGPSSSGSSPGVGGDELGLLPEPVLVELRLHERERQRRRDDRFDVDLSQEVRQPADVILVAVREDHRADESTLEVADVRQEEIDAEVLVAREREPRVDDDDLVADLVHGHVLADLAEAAERDDPERVAHAAESTDVRRARR